jgi:hypothetical protein
MERGGVESLVEASAAEAEAISAALAAAEAKSREQNGDLGADATGSGKPPSSPSSAALMSLNRQSMATPPVHTPPTGVRLHHRAVRILSICFGELVTLLFRFSAAFVLLFMIS